MINIALIEKILQVSGEKEENIAKIMKELSDTLNHKFGTMFIIYVEEKVDDDAELDKFAKFIEDADKITAERIEEYVKWTKENSEVDFDEFWKKFDEATQKLERDIIDRVKKNLTDAQKKEIIDFIHKQKDELEKADEEYIKLLEEIGEDVKKKAKPKEEPVAENVPTPDTRTPDASTPDVTDTPQEEDDDDIKVIV